MWENVYNRTKDASARDLAVFSWSNANHAYLARQSFLAGLGLRGIQKWAGARSIDEDCFRKWSRYAKYKRYATRGLEWYPPEFVITDMLSNLIGAQLLRHVPPQKGRLFPHCLYRDTPTHSFIFHPSIHLGTKCYDLFSPAYVSNGHLHIYASRPFPQILRYVYNVRNLSEIENVNPDLFWAIMAKHEG